MPETGRSPRFGKRESGAGMSPDGVFSPEWGDESTYGYKGDPDSAQGDTRGLVQDEIILLVFSGLLEFR